MSATRSRTGGRSRRAWRTASVALLGLISGTMACRWSGNPCQRDPVVNPLQPSAATLTACQSWTASPGGRPRQGAPGTAAAETAGSASDLLLTSAGGTADGADPIKAGGQDKDKKDRKALGKAASYQVDRTLPSPAAGMVTPDLPAPEKVQPISLAAALAQAGVENPVIAIADQAVRVSRAQLLSAQVLLLPSVNVGSSYDLHNGPLQGSPGEIRKVDRQAVYYGLGAYAVVAGTVAIPGLWINTPLADALFDPLVARQVVANRRFAATATRNQVLLEVSSTYLALLGAEGRLAVIRQSEKDFEEVARLTRRFAQRGPGREGDANRAFADLQALQFEEKRVQEDVAVAAADLARLLNLDPSMRLQTGDVPIQVVQFVDPKEPLPKLLEIAARYRPELMAAAANIRASQVRVNQETYRPLLPLLWAGFSSGDFGGGAVAIQNPAGVNPATLTDGAGQPNGHTTPVFGNVAPRVDVDVMAIWTLQNFGLGNLAHVKQRRAQLGQAQASRLGVLNQVNLEVSEAYNLSAQNFRSIEIERRNVQEATDGFQRDLERIVGGVGLPIEVLDSAERLVAARQNLLAAIIGFDRAQFQLFVALGQPPTLVVDEDKPPVPSPPVQELPANAAPAELPPPNALPPEKK